MAHSAELRLNLRLGARSIFDLLAGDGVVNYVKRTNSLERE